MSTTGSAQRLPSQFDLPANAAELDQPDNPRSDLQREVAERLAAHRSRRNRQSGPALIATAAPEVAPKTVRKKANSIAAAVAERYAHSPTYRDFLAAEAERAIAQAQAAAEEADAAAHVAARSAKAIVAAQQQLLEELENWNQPAMELVARVEPQTQPNRLTSLNHPEVSDRGESEPDSRRHVEAFEESLPSVPFQPPPVAIVSRRSTVVSLAPADLTVRLYEDFGTRQPLAAVQHRSDMAAHATQSPADPEESFALDEEIEFRQAPVFEEPAGPTVAITANLIEFPRQLVASRKARPRIAEGPLREEAEATAVSTQLRIFEVEPELISTEPLAEAEAATPVWASILLDAPAVPQVSFVEEKRLSPPLELAPLNLRLMASIVDLCAVSTTFLVSITAFALWANILPSGIPAVATAIGIFAVLFVLYNLLFFTFSDATPGMRYARLGLCTFDDENPTRAQMRHRIAAVLLAALPLGLGFLWSWMDGERLGWHDRLSGMYQRHY